MIRWVHIFGAVAVASAAACRATGDAARSSAADGARSPNTLVASLDSCNAVQWPGDTAGTVVGRGSAWADGAIREFGRYSLFVPASAHVTGADTVGGGVAVTWPDCPGCRFLVAIVPDSDGRGIEGRVARLLAAQRAIDSANHDPQSTVGEFDEIDGPPQAFTTPTGRGYLIDEDCGDCISTSLLFGRPGAIATITIGGDDDVPMIPRHVCEMIVLGKTLRWRGGR